MDPKKELCWKKWTLLGKVPEDAVMAGKDHEGNSVYVGRAQLRDKITERTPQLVPAKLVKSNAYITYGGKVLQRDIFDFCCMSSPKWEKCCGAIPDGAVVGGCNKAGDLLYIGRVLYKHSVTPGTINPKDGRLSIVYGGGVVSLKEDFEILLL